MNVAIDSLNAVIGDLCDAELLRSGRPHTLSSVPITASGETAARVLDALAGDEEMDPDLWINLLLRCPDRGVTPYAELFAALGAHDGASSPAAAAARMDAYGRLGAAIVRQILRATDHLIAQELKDGFHYQQALRRWRINEASQEAANV